MEHLLSVLNRVAALIGEACSSGRCSRVCSRLYHVLSSLPDSPPEEGLAARFYLGVLQGILEEVIRESEREGCRETALALREAISVIEVLEWDDEG